MVSQRQVDACNDQCKCFTLIAHFVTVGLGIYFLLAMLISLIKDSGPHSYMCKDLQSAAYIIN